MIFLGQQNSQLEIYKRPGMDKLKLDEANGEYIDKIHKLEGEFKTLKRDSESKLNNLIKEKAVIEQRVTFLEQEKEEALVNSFV